MDDKFAVIVYGLIFLASLLCVGGVYLISGFNMIMLPVYIMLILPACISLYAFEQSMESYLFFKKCEKEVEEKKSKKAAKKQMKDFMKKVDNYYE